MGEYKEETWAFIPARGGSKSIPMKNMVKLGGRPLIEYVIRAGQASHSVSRIICSTENDKIADFCIASGIEVQKRPFSLAQDNIPTLDVIVYFLETFIKEEGAVASIIVLLEPTSPFVLPRHIDECVALIKSEPEVDSVQSVTPVPPNHHAYNQRFLKDGLLRFRFPGERVGRFNKQLKPKFYVHGNLRVLRSTSLLKKRDIYGDRSLPYIIPRAYAVDVDGPEDLELAECYLFRSLVRAGDSGLSDS